MKLRTRLWYKTTWLYDISPWPLSALLDWLRYDVLWNEELINE